MRTDEELMADYVRGDGEALGEIYRRYQRPLRSSLVKRGLRRSDAEDAVQLTFVRMDAARTRYRLGEPLRPWLFAIAHNIRRDAARASARRTHVALEKYALPSACDTLRPLEQRETVVMVRRALAVLTPPLRETVERHFLEERDFSEIAKTSGIAQGTLRVRAHRACAALRAALAPAVDERLSARACDRADRPARVA